LELQQTEGHFDAFVRLKSFTTLVYNKSIYLPINFTSISKKYESEGWRRMTSFLLCDNHIQIRWEKEQPEKKTKGIVVGADQGIKTTVTLSDTQTTVATCPHGHSLESIIDKVSRKKRGSKAFKRAVAHRTNYINYSVNRLNLSNIKEVRFEEIKNINHGRRTSRKMRSWTNTTIRDKVSDVCIRSGVRFELASSIYRSQRCSGCGIVLKANRKGKIYRCKRCNMEMDADLNAACNHSVDLVDIPYSLMHEKLNRQGFYWLAPTEENPRGLFDLTMQELIVPAQN